jgi:hypothetical protein
LSNPTLARIAEVLQLAIQKIKLVQFQSSELEEEIHQAASTNLNKAFENLDIQDPYVKTIEGQESGQTDSHRRDEAESSGTSFQSAWEKWCNAKYGANPKTPTDHSAHSMHSTSNIETPPVINVDCKHKQDIMISKQKWQAWAKTQKMIHKDHISWSDLALRITWGFTGNLGIWWERVTARSKLRIFEHEKPIDELAKAVIHEFYGDVKIDTDHYADLFMNQKLCHLSQLPKFYCTMKDLLYKVPDPENVAYLRK